MSKYDEGRGQERRSDRRLLRRVFPEAKRPFDWSEDTAREFPSVSAHLAELTAASPVSGSWASPPPRSPWSRSWSSSLHSEWQRKTEEVLFSSSFVVALLLCTFQFVALFSCRPPRPAPCPARTSQGPSTSLPLFYYALAFPGFLGTAHNAKETERSVRRVQLGSNAREADGEERLRLFSSFLPDSPVLGWL